MKYTVTVNATYTSYAEVEIEAESAEAAEDRAWEMLDADEIELLDDQEYIEINSYAADED